MCLDRKVLVGLGALALGVVVFAPGAFSLALPSLALLACPLSMVFMMRRMSGDRRACDTRRAQAAAPDADAPMPREEVEVAERRGELAAGRRPLDGAGI